MLFNREYQNILDIENYNKFLESEKKRKEYRKLHQKLYKKIAFVTETYTLRKTHPCYLEDVKKPFVERYRYHLNRQKRRIKQIIRENRIKEDMLEGYKSLLKDNSLSYIIDNNEIIKNINELEAETKITKEIIKEMVIIYIPEDNEARRKLKRKLHRK